MTEYVYTGAHPRILLGLAQGVNASHFPHSGDPSGLPEGSTIVVEPGDSVRTDEPYPHPELVESAPEAAPDHQDPDHPDAPAKGRAKRTNNPEGTAK